MAVRILVSPPFPSCWSARPPKQQRPEHIHIRFIVANIEKISVDNAGEGKILDTYDLKQAHLYHLNVTVDFPRSRIKVHELKEWSNALPPGLVNWTTQKHSEVRSLRVTVIWRLFGQVRPYVRGLRV